jgi:Fe-S-cluster containining protein
MQKVIQIKRVQDDARVFIDMADSVDNPCMSCGVCCSHFRVSFSWTEVLGETGVPAELVRPLGRQSPRVCMEGTQDGGGRCVALKGTIGQPGIGCNIYSNRPSVCREYPVWQDDGSPNPDCQRLRAAAGLPLLEPQR